MGEPAAPARAPVLRAFSLAVVVNELWLPTNHFRLVRGHCDLATGGREGGGCLPTLFAFLFGERLCAFSSISTGCCRRRLVPRARCRLERGPRVDEHVAAGASSASTHRLNQRPLVCLTRADLSQVARELQCDCHHLLGCGLNNSTRRAPAAKTRVIYLRSKFQLTLPLCFNRSLTNAHKVTADTLLLHRHRVHTLTVTLTVDTRAGARARAHHVNLNGRGTRGTRTERSRRHHRGRLLPTARARSSDASGRGASPALDAP